MGLVVEPSATVDELVAKISDVSNRSPEARDAQPQEKSQNFRR